MQPKAQQGRKSVLPEGGGERRGRRAKGEAAVGYLDLRATNMEKLTELYPEVGVHTPSILTTY